MDIKEKLGFKAEDVFTENNYSIGSRIHVVGESKVKTTSVKVLPDKGHVAESTALDSIDEKLIAKITSMEKDFSELKELIELRKQLITK